MRRLLVVMAVVVICLFSKAQLQAASYQMHTISAGETYFNIANDFRTDVSSLKALNNQWSDHLEVGDLLKINQIKDIKVKVNDQYIRFDAQPYIENGRVFVPIRFVSDALASDSVSWNQSTKTATIKEGSKTITMTVGSYFAFVNGKAVELDAPVQLYDGRTFVPIRFFSNAMNVDSIGWDQSTYTVIIKKAGLGPIKQSYSEEDLYWLSRLVNAEAKGEPFAGKVAVANTIINRVGSPDYPDTIKGVIFDTKFDVQYTPVANGSIYETPSEESIRAAKAALEGYNNVGGSMYFVNPDIASNSWIQENRTFYTSIGNHDFYI